MNGTAEFTVTGRAEARRAVAGGIRAIAEGIAAEAAARTPRRTGQLASGWETEQGRDPATVVVVNRWQQLMYLEYGTRRQPARPVLGPVVAAARARWGR